MKVFVVDGEHPQVPGHRQSVHASFAGAHKAAASLVNIIAEDMNNDLDPSDVHVATAECWDGILSACQDYYGAQYCYVTVTAREVQS